VVIELRCHWRGFEGPVTGETLRHLPIARLTKLATDQVALRLVSDEDGSVRAVSAHPPEDLAVGEERRVEIAGEVDANFARQTKSPRRRGPLREEDLKRVAEVYRGAIARGRPPTKTVAGELGVARSTAGRWVAEARRRGVLGRAKPRVAGEINDENAGGSR
jgi:hypothetical protein